MTSQPFQERPAPEPNELNRSLLLREAGQKLERAVARLTRYVDLELDERPVTPAMQKQAYRYSVWANLLAEAYGKLAAGERPDTRTLEQLVREP